MSTIGDLDPLLPNGTGTNGKVSGGDDHLRKIKDAIITSFAGWNINPGVTDVLRHDAVEISDGVDDGVAALILANAQTALINAKMPLQGGTFAGDVTFDASRQLILDSGTLGAPALTFAGDPDTGFFSYANNGLEFVCEGFNVLRMFSAVGGTLGALLPEFPIQGKVSSDVTYSWAGNVNTGLGISSGSPYIDRSGVRHVGFNLGIMDIGVAVIAAEDVVCQKNIIAIGTCTGTNVLANNETRLAALEATLAVFAGKVTGAGVGDLPAGWTSVKDATGTYTITHTLATQYSFVGTVWSANVRFCTLMVRASFSLTYKVYDDAGTLVDGEVMFMMKKL